jgi:fatty-acyl-CoA synthase
MTVVSSYVHGASAQALIGQTIGNYFDEVCARHSAREALVVTHQKVRLSYGELHDKANRLACGLMRLGLKRGERIGIWSQNNLEWALTQFATAKAGLVMVNINPAYRRAELEYALNKVGCRALILSLRIQDQQLPGNDRRPGARAGHPPPACCARFACPPEYVIRMGVSAPRACSISTTADARPPRANSRRWKCSASELQFDDPINIQFTSGTTGAPKGATLSHHNILNNGFFVGEAMRLTPEMTGCAFRCRCITASAWCWATWRA